MTTEWFDDLSKRMEEFKKEIQKEGQSHLEKAFKRFTEENPEVKAIGWYQYTPYFNDGEECTFGVHEPHFFKEEFDGSSDLDEIEEFGSKPSSWYYKEADKGDAEAIAKIKDYEDNKKLIDAIESFSKSIFKCEAANDIFKLSFGDHCRVIFKGGEFDVSEYGHD